MKHSPWGNWDIAGINNEVSAFKSTGYEVILNLNNAEKGICKLTAKGKHPALNIVAHKIDIGKLTFLGKKKFGWLAEVELPEMSDIENYTRYFVGKTQADMWSQIGNLFAGIAIPLNTLDDAQKVLAKL